MDVKNNRIIVENVRSAYNVGNIIRTADALWWDVVISGYSPSPFRDDKVLKSSLWAEKNVTIYEERNTTRALTQSQEEDFILVAAEITDDSVPLDSFDVEANKIAVVVGNEVEWVLPETLAMVDYIVHIPMLGQKASLNVGQASAIFMWKLGKYCKKYNIINFC